MWLQHDSRDRNEMTKIGFHLENIQSRFNHERVERVCIEAFAFLLFLSGCTAIPLVIDDVNFPK